MAKNITEIIYETTNKVIKDRFEYSCIPQDEIDAYRDGYRAGMEKMYEMMTANKNLIEQENN